MEKEKNIAFIDGQNLHLWTASENWKIDFARFRVYLKDKFKIEKAYYYLGFLDEDEQELYFKLQEAGFIIVFREHNSNMKWKKKGNVDVDIVFEIMKQINEKVEFDKVVLVSGDWDYIKMVKYLIEIWKFKKILFPNSKFSSLYNPLAFNHWLNLSIFWIRKKFEYKKRGALR